MFRTLDNGPSCPGSSTGWGHCVVFFTKTFNFHSASHQGTFNKSTAFFHGLHFVDHRNDVMKCSKPQWNHEPLGEWFHCKVLGIYGGISMVCRGVDYGKMCPVCFIQ